VVQVDADLAVAVTLVAEGVLDLGNAAIRRRVKVVLAHRLGGRAVEVDLVVVEDDLLPAHAARSKGETLILGEAAGDLVATDEVREGSLTRGAEGVFSRLGRLEEHVHAAIAVELVSRLRGRFHVVTAFQVRL